MSSKFATLISPSSSLIGLPTSGDDILVGTINDDFIAAMNGDDHVSGLAGDDTLVGGLGDDTLLGGAGNDRLLGDGGNNVFNAGSNVFDGGADFDTVIYSHAITNVIINLQNGQHARAAVNDSFVNIEGFVGTDLGDSFVLDQADNRIIGRGGDDFIDGWTGNDTLVGGAGRDFLHGNYGFDIASYVTSPQAVNIGMIGVGQGGDAEGDVLSWIEGIIGSTHNDTISGSAGFERLVGHDGNDSISGLGNDDKLLGGNGNDTLDAGSGRDILRGGDGADRLIAGTDGKRDALFGGGADGDTDVFVFSSTGADAVIKDFELGVDLIEISGATQADLTMTDIANGVLIGVAGHSGFSVLVTGTTAAQLQLDTEPDGQFDSFIFV